MKYTVEAKGAELSIKIEAAGEKQEKLLRSLQECAEGRCSCPTSQYEKLEAIDIEPDPVTVHITLKAKAGERVDVTDIERCMVHTTRLAEDG